ncbi:MAG TPA: MaoC family dehydratase N-terminal domain-containing protein [Anaeromyxobacteraceae bacterium]|jgi:acyl dehydratase|nr:MaoC family dehydratase N-terminal domain-containing protein [Anaeromyxobacteraceae bacterium]
MPIDRRHLGRRYGPYRYAVGLEKLRDFAVAVAGGIPGAAFPSAPPAPPHPWLVDEEAGAASPYGSLVGAPTFCATFAMRPFADACVDPALGIDLVRLVHAEQEFEYGAPVRPGDVIETAGEVTGIEQKSRLDFLTVTTTSRNQRGELVVRGTWTAIIRG